MCVDWIKQKIIFVNRSKNPIDEKKSILRPVMAIINIYTLIAIFCCVSSAILFYYFVENIFFAVTQLPARFNRVTNDLVLIQTKKNPLIILASSKEDPDV
jgi:membrane protein CcdC involved in cytochrome C biogenesis